MLKKRFKEFKKTSTSQNVLVYEGNEGCGKSSILGHISKILEKKTKKKKKYKNHRIVSLELSDNKECAIKKMYDMLPKREAECHSSEPIDICSAFHAEVLKGPVVFLIDYAHNMDDLSAKSLQLFLPSLQRNVLLIMAKQPFESNNAVNSFFEGPSVVKVNM